MGAEKQIFKITNKDKFNQFIKDHPDFEFKKQDVLLRVLARETMYVFREGHGKFQYTWENPSRQMPDGPFFRCVTVRR